MREARGWHGSPLYTRHMVKGQTKGQVKLNTLFPLLPNTCSIDCFITYNDTEMERKSVHEKKKMLPFPDR